MFGHPKGDYLYLFMKYVVLLIVLVMCYPSISKDEKRTNSRRTIPRCPWGDYLWVPVKEADKLFGRSRCYRPDVVAFSLAAGSSGGLVPVYRYFDSIVNMHFWTTDRNEAMQNQRLRREGIVGYAAANPSGSSQAIYKFYNPKTLRYFYSFDSVDTIAIREGFSGYQGIAFYAWAPGQAEINLLRIYCSGPNEVKWNHEDSLKWQAAR